MIEDAKCGGYFTGVTLRPEVTVTADSDVANEASCIIVLSQFDLRSPSLLQASVGHLRPFPKLGDFSSWHEAAERGCPR
jgi:hypothetical protein